MVNYFIKPFRHLPVECVAALRQFLVLSPGLHLQRVPDVAPGQGVHGACRCHKRVVHFGQLFVVSEQDGLHLPAGVRVEVTPVLPDCNWGVFLHLAPGTRVCLDKTGGEVTRADGVQRSQNGGWLLNKHPDICANGRSLVVSDKRLKRVVVRSVHTVVQILGQLLPVGLSVVAEDTVNDSLHRPSHVSVCVPEFEVKDPL